MDLNALVSVYLIVLLGGVLRHFHFIQDNFIQFTGKILDYILLPGFIFWALTCNGDGISVIDFKLLFASACAMGPVFILSCVYIQRNDLSGFKAVFFSQSCYRANPYFGIAIVYCSYDQTILKNFCILIGCMIPLMDLLVVSAACWVAREKYTPKTMTMYIVRHIVKDPLLIALLAAFCAMGLGLTFPHLIEKFFRFIFLPTLPLSLVAIGGALTVQNLKYHFRQSLVSSLFKLILLPFSGYMMLYLFDLTAEPASRYALLFFSLPAMFARTSDFSKFSPVDQTATPYPAISTALGSIPMAVILFLKQ